MSTGRWHLISIFMLALAAVCLAAGPSLAQTPDFCTEAGIRCVSLFDAMIGVRGNAPVFINPQVSVDLLVRDETVDTIRVYLPPYDALRVIKPDNGKCPLLVVGIADETDDAETSLYYEDIPANERSTRQLLTFCVSVGSTNLPGDPRIRTDALNMIGFPSGDFSYTTEPWTSNLSSLVTVIERARDATCSTGDGVPLSWRSFATQLAVFMAVDPAPAPFSIWDLYANAMENRAFLDDYTGIYCLLRRDAPQPLAALTASPITGESPLQVALVDGSSGDIAGYDITISRQGQVPIFQVTSAAFPAETLAALTLATPGSYTARLSVLGPPASYLAGTVIPQPVSTIEAAISVQPARQATPTPIGTPLPTVVPPLRQFMSGEPFGNAPGLTGQDGLLLFAMFVAGIAILAAFLNGGGIGILLQSRRLLLVLIFLTLLVLAFTLWGRAGFSLAIPTPAVAATPPSEAAP